jgi:hypothetical protein
VVTRGAKAITGEDPGPESETTGKEIGAGLQRGQIEIKTQTVTEIEQESLEGIETVRDMDGGIVTGAEAEIDIAAPKVCISH